MYLYPRSRSFRLPCTGHWIAPFKDASKYEWIVFTSANGVRSVLGRCAVLGIDFSALGQYDVSPLWARQTAKTMEDAGLTVSAIPHAYRSDRLPDAIRGR